MAFLGQLATSLNTFGWCLKSSAIPALYVEINSGQSIHRLIFDCGEACLRDLPVPHIQAIEGLFFSHFHIDHVAGFDVSARATTTGRRARFASGGRPHNCRKRAARQITIAQPKFAVPAAEPLRTRLASL